VGGWATDRATPPPGGQRPRPAGNVQPQRAPPWPPSGGRSTLPSWSRARRALARAVVRRTSC
jgi:hypothetical protein